FMGGMVGRFMSSFGLTAAFAIAVSLLVSFTLTPMLSARFLKAKPETEAANGHSSKDSWFFSKLDKVYTAMLVWAMAHRKTMVTVSVLVVLSVVPVFRVIGKNLQAEDDRGEFEIGIAAPEGTGLAATGTILDRIAREVRGLRGVVATLTTTGGGSDRS